MISNFTTVLLLGHFPLSYCCYHCTGLSMKRNTAPFLVHAWPEYFTQTWSRPQTALPSPPSGSPELGECCSHATTQGRSEGNCLRGKKLGNKKGTDWQNGFAAQPFDPLAFLLNPTQTPGDTPTARPGRGNHRTGNISALQKHRGH